ncbi:hypothetical protein ACFQZW_11555 [Lutibacter aestuarii]|uniref:EF-hand domain-containing protein n=1 Tax=Lutibacter aestuarii TaxID=861111 RepID=A0ABW2Z7Q5_9FLAO
MKLFIVFSISFLSLNISSQNLSGIDWKLFSDENVESIVVTNETDFFSIDRYNFEMNWNEQLSYSDNIGYYGGIEEMRIYDDNHLITKIVDIEDIVALGEIYFEFYDYNFDGYIDFSYPISQGK